MKIRRPIIIIFLCYFLSIALFSLNLNLIGSRQPAKVGSDSVFEQHPSVPHSSSDGIVRYIQDFNDEIPADYKGDGVWRIPTGWTSLNYTDDFALGVSGTYTYPLTSGSMTTYPDWHTNFLMVRDFQNTSMTYIERDLPKVSSGSLEFQFYMSSNYYYAYRNEIFLQNASGYDILTLTMFKPADYGYYGILLETTDAGQEYIGSQATIYLNLTFANGIADLMVNGSNILSDIAYTSGSISHIKISTGPLESSAYYGAGYYDSFILTQIPFTSSNLMINSQDFNNEIPANNEGDGVWRIPTGWNAIEPSVFPGGTYCYPLNEAPIGAYLTPSLGIIDTQPGSIAEIWRDFPSNVTAGTFEYSFYVRAPFEALFQNDLILESVTGTDLITVSAVKLANSNVWTHTLQGMPIASFYTTYTEYIHLKIFFSGGFVNLTINGSQYFTGVSYFGDDVTGIRITTGPTGSACVNGTGYYDNMVLTDGLLLQKPAAPTLLPITSPDYDGEYIINWTAVNQTDYYRLYRASTSIIDPKNLLPVYEGSAQIYNESGMNSGVYYYIVLVFNGSGASPASNSIMVAIPPNPPSFIDTPVPDETGSFVLNWSSAIGADTYQLYRSTSEISNVSTLIPFYNGSLTFFSERNLQNGTYFYCLTASNDFWVTLPSQSMNITIATLPPPSNTTGTGSYQPPQPIPLRILLILCGICGGLIGITLLFRYFLRTINTQRFIQSPDFDTFFNISSDFLLLNEKLFSPREIAKYKRYMVHQIKFDIDVNLLSEQQFLKYIPRLKK